MAVTTFWSKWSLTTKIAVIAPAVVALILVVVLPLVLSRHSSDSGKTPQQKCNTTGYVWDPLSNSCTKTSCTATVDDMTGLVTGQVLDMNGTACVSLNSKTYVSSIAENSLSNLCQTYPCKVPSLKCDGSSNFNYYAVNTQKCVIDVGCAADSYAIDGDSSTAKLLNGCPNMTLTQNPENKGECVAPDVSQLQMLCETSISGCPFGSTLSAACSETGVGDACYSPGQATCLPASSNKGCRPDDIGTAWQWNNGQCVNITVSPYITNVSVTGDPTDLNINGIFEIEHDVGETVLYTYQMHPNASGLTPLTGYAQVTFGPLTSDTNVKSTVKTLNNFTINFKSGGNGPSVDQSYDLELQGWVLQNQGEHPIIRYVSDKPITIKVVKGTLPPGITQLLPKPTRQIALNVASSMGLNNVIQSANNNTKFKQIPENSNTWTNMELPTYCTGDACSTIYLLVPCTTEYCVSSNNRIDHAMLVLAWEAPSVADIELAQKESGCNNLSTGAQVLYYASMKEFQPSGVSREIQLFDGGTMPRWFGSITTIPGYFWEISIGTYLWPQGGSVIPSWINASCKSPLVKINVQVPSTFYSSSTCFSIKPLTPAGNPIPGNYNVYNSTINGCQPVTSLSPLEITAARDVNCMWNIGDSLLPDNTNPSVNVGSLVMYTCENGDKACELTTDARNPCGIMMKNTSPIESVDNPISIPQVCSSKKSYTRKVYCGCSDRVQNTACGNQTFADIGATGSGVVSKDNWENRLQQASKFIDNYDLLSGDGVFGPGKKAMMGTFQTLVNNGNLDDTWKKYQECYVQNDNPTCWASSGTATCGSQCGKDTECLKACNVQSFDCLSNNILSAGTTSGVATFDCTQWKQGDSSDVYAYSQNLTCYPPPTLSSKCPTDAPFLVKGVCVKEVPTTAPQTPGLCYGIP